MSDVSVFQFPFPDDIRPGGLCPVQAHGPVADGLIYYFRARGEEWRFDVGAPDPKWGDYVDEPVWSAWGEWGHGAHHAGYMPAETAVAIIRDCLRSYRAGEPSDRQRPDHAHMPEGWAP